ncbi:MAG: hypothetical protein ABI761_10980 [Saprospiraceae bacterium]
MPREEIIPFLKIVLGFKHTALVTIKKLISWCTDYKELPDWMLITCHATTGDWVETLSLVLGNPDLAQNTEKEFLIILDKINFFRISKNEEELKSWLLTEWGQRSPEELYLIFKLITGNIKSIISKQITANLLHELFVTDPLLLRHRLNELHSEELTYEQLMKNSWSVNELKSKPYPFIEPEEIALSSYHFGDIEHWIVEPFLHGTRIQIHRSDSGVKIRNDDQDLVGIQETEILREFNLLPVDTVIDVLYNGEVSNHYFILDIHRWNEKEKTELGSLLNRKEIISSWLHSYQIIHLQLLPHNDLSSLRKVTLDSKENRIIKNIHDDRRYRIKPEASRMYAAVMYAEYINQNTSIQYVITLGIYNEDKQLMPLTKISSDQLPGTDKNELNYWIQNNTIQKFGPVRVVRSGKIMCIAYDRIQLNKRVKSGIALINVKVIQILNQSAGKNPISSITEISISKKDQDI